MLEGLLHHGTDAEIDADYTDTHGATITAFAFCHLLGFRLLPRINRPAHQIQRALDALQLAGRATRTQIATAGRPAELWTATAPTTPAA